MGVFSAIKSAAKSAAESALNGSYNGLVNYGRSDREGVRPDNPMQQVIDSVIASSAGGEGIRYYTLADLESEAQRQGLTLEQVRNFEGVTTSGINADGQRIALKLTESDVLAFQARLEAAGVENTQQPILGHDANLAYTQFVPYHTVGYVETTREAISGTPPDLSHAVLVTPPASERSHEPVAAELSGKITGLVARGADGGPAHSLRLSLDGAQAQAVDFTGSLQSRLTVRNCSDISGFDGSGSHALTIDVQSSYAHNVNLDGAILGPGSCFLSSHLSGSMRNATLSPDMSFAGSHLCGEEMFAGTDICRVTPEGWQKTLAQPDVFIGARVLGQVIVTVEQAQQFMAERGIGELGAAQTARQFAQTQQSHRQGTAAYSSDMGAIAASYANAPSSRSFDPAEAARCSLPETDTLIASLEATCGVGGAAQTEADRAADVTEIQLTEAPTVARQSPAGRGSLNVG